MTLRITKHDIGAEILSILTKGMYPDPKDALREYVQNSVDAEATEIQIKIRSDSIVIVDNGHGMDETVMRGAVRVGISDKNPIADVGFRGIGIYSSFHLCDTLSIYSMPACSSPHLLVFDFEKMREVLKQQQQARLTNSIKAEDLIDLQAILQANINLQPLSGKEFAHVGTRVELTGLEPNFFVSLAKFDEVSNYLRQVIPLHFDANNFKCARKIENKIQSICSQHKAPFSLVDVELQVNTQTEKLYRPYTDDLFEGGPQEPTFVELKADKEFLGVIWGCLNTARAKIDSREFRGFILRKQGFAIGQRTDLLKYFKRSTFFDRYVGEVVVVHPELLPNASRNEFEPSVLRTIFYESLQKGADKLNDDANNYQELSKGDAILDDAILQLRKLQNQAGFQSESADKLLDVAMATRDIIKRVEDRLKREDGFREKRQDIARKVLQTAKSLEKEVQSSLNIKKQKNKQENLSISRKKTNDQLRKLPSVSKPSENAPANLVQVLSELDIDVTRELKIVFELIDEKFIQAFAGSKSEYLQLLSNLKRELEEALAEENG